MNLLVLIKNWLPKDICVYALCPLSSTVLACELQVACCVSGVGNCGCFVSKLGVLGGVLWAQISAGPMTWMQRLFVVVPEKRIWR